MLVPLVVTGPDDSAPSEPHTPLSLKQAAMNPVVPTFTQSCMQATNVDVFNGTIRDLVGGVLYGINTTVFAYVSAQTGAQKA